jgi:hypothetical protein
MENWFLKKPDFGEEKAQGKQEGWRRFEVGRAI